MGCGTETSFKTLQFSLYIQPSVGMSVCPSSYLLNQHWWFLLLPAGSNSVGWREGCFTWEIILGMPCGTWAFLCEEREGFPGGWLMELESGSQRFETEQLVSSPLSSWHVGWASCNKQWRWVMAWGPGPGPQEGFEGSVSSKRAEDLASSTVVL